MTVNTTQITSGPYSGNDIADEFSYTFRIEGKTQLIVYETDDQGVETTLTVDTDYTVADIGVDAGGTVTRVAGPLPTGYEGYIRSDYKETQLTAFASQGGLNHIKFHRNDEISVIPMTLTPGRLQELESHMNSMYLQILYL